MEQVALAEELLDSELGRCPCVYPNLLLDYATMQSGEDPGNCQWDSRSPWILGSCSELLYSLAA